MSEFDPFTLKWTIWYFCVIVSGQLLNIYCPPHFVYCGSGLQCVYCEHCVLCARVWVRVWLTAPWCARQQSNKGHIRMTKTSKRWSTSNAATHVLFVSSWYYFSEKWFFALKYYLTSMMRTTDAGRSPCLKPQHSPLPTLKVVVLVDGGVPLRLVYRGEVGESHRKSHFHTLFGASNF